MIAGVHSETQSTHCAAELIERRDISPNLATLRFRVSEQPSFTAGQFATIGVFADGVLLERPYSIVSSPHEPCFEFFIELVPGGSITPKLWTLKLGSVILVRRRIVGQLILNTTVTQHLMLATVTGIAPFVSILRTEKIERERGAPTNDQFLVIHGASQSADFGSYRSELEELSRAGWLTYIPTVSRPWLLDQKCAQSAQVRQVAIRRSTNLDV